MSREVPQDKDTFARLILVNQKCNLTDIKGQALSFFHENHMHKPEHPMVFHVKSHIPILSHLTNSRVGAMTGDAQRHFPFFCTFVLC